MQGLVAQLAMAYVSWRHRQSIKKCCALYFWLILEYKRSRQLVHIMFYFLRNRVYLKLVSTYTSYSNHTC